jgi:hypothetical protein
LSSAVIELTGNASNSLGGGGVRDGEVTCSMQGFLITTFQLAFAFNYASLGIISCKEDYYNFVMTWRVFLLIIARLLPYFFAGVAVKNDFKRLNVYLINYRSKPSGHSGSTPADIAFVFLFWYSTGIREQLQRSNAIPETGVALVPPARTNHGQQAVLKRL